VDNASVTADAKHLTTEELEAGLDSIYQSPKDEGVLQLIVRRPQIGERELPQEAELSLTHGLIGDNWSSRGSTRTPDGSSNPAAQITVMNARAIDLVAQGKDRWPLAGDQLFIDLDLSVTNLPSGTRLAVGSAVIEVSAHPHTGCGKFAARFGPEAMKFINSPLGKRLQLRGINTRVVQPGVIRIGDVVKKTI